MNLNMYNEVVKLFGAVTNYFIGTFIRNRLCQVLNYSTKDKFNRIYIH